MNCSFNIRYKPRTTRAFTKSDLTVYDSADNTALNALTVYGKSEVVDGAIVSAGEGWATVDLGTLTWEYQSDTHFFASRDLASIILAPIYTIPANIVTNAPYVVVSRNDISDKKMCINAGGFIVIMDSAYTDATTLKNTLSGILLAYPLIDPTQGNAIAVKTDNGSGINGTMAVFETGTPLYGINENTRDVMQWDGSAGTVTKVCNKSRLADLTWTYWSAKNCFSTKELSNQKIITAFQISPYLCAKYTVTEPYIYGLWQTSPNKSIFQSISEGFVVIHDTAYTTVSDFVASLGDAELVYELADPTTQNLTSTENTSIAGLRTFTPQTHAQNNAQAEMTIDYTIKVPTN